MKKFLVAIVTAFASSIVLAYPLDGEDESGIRRLQGYNLAQQAATGSKLKSGQLWGVGDVKLNLLDYAGPDFDKLDPDPELSTALAAMFSKRDASYSMVVIDYSDSKNLRWAGLRPDIKQNPGSVGKLLCMTALFYALAEVFPDQQQRAMVLKSALVKAGDWVTTESHKVPKWNETTKRNDSSVINSNDEFRLNEWIDHAISPSANGAGAIIWREAMLIRQFGDSYPIDQATRNEFFAKTPKSELSALAKAVITEPLIAAGIDTSSLQQGSSFTAAGKQKVPGTVSYGTSRELARLLFRMEQGKLVDGWSSLQMKKFMYLTKRRYRYAYAPELDDKAVFFKSGSFYSCKPQMDGVVSKCGKYMGDKQNLMNSVAIVEAKDDSEPKYISVLMSNVFEVNSAWDHSRIGAAVDEMVRTRKPQQLQENASTQEILESGRGD